MIWLIATLVMAGGDTIELRDSSEGHVAEVFYSNASGQESKPGTFALEHNGVRVIVTISFQKSGNDEIIQVQVPDETLIAMPDEMAVADGEETVIQIMRPMF